MSSSKGPRRSNKLPGTKKKFSGKPRKKHSRRRPRRDDDAPLVPSTPPKPNAADIKAQESTAKQLAKMLAQPPAEPPREDGRIIPDPWQQQAQEALLAGDNVVVDAPTSAGKTKVVEDFFALSLQQPGFRAAYTTPVKSLTNDKLREFQTMFGIDKVGISTGDTKKNLGAPLVVATLESYRNSLMGVEPDLGRNLVVFDEYHYIQDSSRGSAWEEALILSPDNTQMLLLSASVANPQDFVGWLSNIKSRKARLVQTTERPVPLEHMIYHKGAWCLASTLDNLEGRGRPGFMPPLAPEQIAEMLPAADQLGMTPCIVYAAKRLDCENMARAISATVDPIDAEAAKKLKEALKQLNAQYGVGSFIPDHMKNMILDKGVAYHHSGLGMLARLAIESLLKDGLLKYCSATMGLSLGINFSVRSVLVSDSERPSARGPVPYASSEILQMLGRAGRRGRDSVGFTLWPRRADYRRFIPAKREKAVSQLKNEPTTIMGLIDRGYSLSRIETFYTKSLLNQQKSSAGQGQLIRSDKLDQKLKLNRPCESIAHDYARFLNKEESYCFECPARTRCHKALKSLVKNPLAAMHLHLHRIGCIDEEEKLSEFGQLARHFPQGGGMVVARFIHEGSINADKLLQAAQLMAALTTAEFKRPRIPFAYRLPFDVRRIRRMLEEYYPLKLFPEVYNNVDHPYKEPSIREFHPAIGFIAKEWLMGLPFNELIEKVATPAFAAGDVMNVLLRTGTILQSVVGLGIEGMSEDARALWQELMRSPLTMPVGLQEET